MFNKPEWYVIQVVSWTEENVKSSLFQRRESFWLEEFIIDVFVPTHDVVSVRSWWAKVTKKKNILPWYILVQMKTWLLKDAYKFQILKILPQNDLKI